MTGLYANLDAAGRALSALRERGVAHWIGGAAEPPAAGAWMPDISPVNGEELAVVPRGDRADAGRAAQAALNAFDAWAGTPGAQRKRLLHCIADAIESRAEEIALVESLDTGQPIRFMSKAAARGAENFRFFADRAEGARDGLALPAERHLNYTLRQPLGPVGVITPWNTPFMLSTWKIAPALAAGCTVVHKPAEWSPLSAQILSEIATEAGLPAGVLNLVHGVGEEAGRALSEDPAIRAIAFVGESATGAAIMSQAAATLKRVHFELGGKNPVLVFDDADLKRAVDAAAFMIFSLNGERCTSGSRLLVQRGAYDTVVEGLSERLGSIRVGHPLDPDTDVGPLIHADHHEKVRQYLEIAREEGAELRTAGGEPEGLYVGPTLLLGAHNAMRVAQEEIFGPVLTVIPFEDEDEALRLANDVRYGLAAYVWTRELGRAHRLARQLDVGMVWLNSENNRHLPTPFGGMKDSGIGRDGGDYSFDFFMETKNVCVALGDHAIPRMGR